MLKNTFGVGAAYDAISAVYRSMYDYENAETYMDKAIFSLNSVNEYVGVLIVKGIQQQNDFMVSTDINYKGSLSSTDELQIYRIIQEALTNIIKYAKAHAGKITMEEIKNVFLSK